MVENIKILIQDIFISFFQVIWFSSIIAALSLYIYEKNPNKSLKKLIVEFLQMFKNNKKLKRKEKAAVTKYKQPGKRLWKI